MKAILLFLIEASLLLIIGAAAMLLFAGAIDIVVR